MPAHNALTHYIISQTLTLSAVWRKKKTTSLGARNRLTEEEAVRTEPGWQCLNWPGAERKHTAMFSQGWLQSVVEK